MTQTAAIAKEMKDVKKKQTIHIQINQSMWYLERKRCLFVEIS